MNAFDPAAPQEGTTPPAIIGCDPECTAEGGYPALCEMYPDEKHAGCPRQRVSSSWTTPPAEIERILAVYGVTREELDAINHLQEVCGDSQGENDMAMAILWGALTGARAELRSALASIPLSQTDSSLRAAEPLTTEQRTLLQDLARGARTTGPEMVAIAKAIRICDAAASSPTVTPPQTPNEPTYEPTPADATCALETFRGMQKMGGNPAMLLALEEYEQKRPIRVRRAARSTPTEEKTNG